ncbi:MAG: hypothetical protein JW819_08910 [Candidatus Krumholzibacteriota bacterium]|nr:hypothetical protein [Candidatus Krumholzibacteriota bacterium]
MDFRYYEVPEDRELLVLESVIRLYTERAEPVSSAAVARDLRHRWSSATVRNTFGELERQGWLMQPHRSSGRVPTDRGYRVYVERIVRPSQPHPAWERLVHSEMDLRRGSLAESLDQAAALLSRVSHALGLSLLVLAPGPGAAADADAATVTITGIDELLGQPEFDDPRRLKVLIHLLDDASAFGRYLRALADPPGEVRLCIGQENAIEDLSSFTVITSQIHHSDGTALMGLLGPVRMEYSLVLGAMDSLVRLLHSRAGRSSTWS